MSFRLVFRKLALFVLLSMSSMLVAEQPRAAVGTLRGTVLDPSGAVVPKAQISAVLGDRIYTTRSGQDGAYVIQTLPIGAYTVTVTAHGFAPLRVENVLITAGESRELKLPLSLAVEHQEVTVTGQNQTVGVNSDQNASATVISGRDLDALSDDPDELQNELQALAGPSAGPNGGEIYIDGFTGGQLPPKSSILEIRVNQNPFSAEYDRIGYGRIEITTKPGSQKLHGSISSFGNSSALNTANPLIPVQPSYSLYSFSGNISGPIRKHSSFFFDLFRMVRQDEGIVDAVNPANTGQNLRQAFPNPSSILILSPRIDVQMGHHTLTFRDSYWRSRQTGTGVGTLNLPDQASNALDQENTVQFGDTILVNERLVTEVHLQWRRMRNERNAIFSMPTVTVQGAFTTGGNSSGVVQDHQDDYELQSKSTATIGRHTLRFGADMRIYRDANYSTSGSNGTYLFSKISDYLAGKPQLYSATLIDNPLVHAMVYDGSLYLQDDWKLKPNFVLGLGLRYEAQNWIHDRNDWAPRVSFAWSPGHTGSKPAKTVLRAGYGWFYTRFTVPNTFSSFAGTPYVTEVLHDNLVNQRTYVIANPGFYNPNAPEPASVVTSAPSTTPTHHTLDPHFHAALNMQMGIGLDRQLTKTVIGNLTYLYTQGVHQYLSNNVTAPAFDPASYTITGSAPPLYNYQFQSGGVYKESQIIATVSTRLKHLTTSANYSYSSANSDTQGPNSFVSVSQNPGLDYGRATFSIRHQVQVIGSYSAPHAFTLAAAIFARSGVPYNLTIGSDLTANNQFNARPTYGTCGAASVVTTQYGCLDIDPAGKGERLVPYGVGIGPSNSIVLMRASKVVGIGPRIRSASPNERSTIESSRSVSGRGLSGGGATIHLDATAPRKYSLTFVAVVINLFNQVNLGTPNGVLKSQLFNQTQSLAGGQYGSPTAGNRTISFQANFSF